MESPEHRLFKVLEHWKPERNLLSPDKLVDINDPLYPLFIYLYNITKEFYKKLPLRKNGENSFIHPLNNVVNLKMAKVNDVITLCIGLIHDLIEENVDFYQSQNKILIDEKGIKLLDDYEEKICEELMEDLVQFCANNNIDKNVIVAIIEPLKLLTRHKRHFYYSSISSIFWCKDKLVQERAIQAKLADRLHNILCIETFDERNRIYQCFKNLFILNNVKHYLIKNPQNEDSPTRRLFNKCCKATYDAFSTICLLCRDKGISEITPMLHLAFRKFAFIKAGMWEVTQLDKTDVHPWRLFQGIVRKYDKKLHQEYDYFDNTTQSEIEYCKRFFSEQNFSEQQIQAIIDYKDAYALKEIVAKLLYDPKYVLYGFLASELTEEGRIKK